jgi:putative membrane protein
MQCNNARRPFGISAIAIACAVALNATSVAAADPTSPADKTFVAMVSQGGLFETLAGELASTQGSAQDIRDQGSTEAHDHGLVNARLKEIAEADDLTISDSPNPMFQKMLDALAAQSGRAFDNLYLTDMGKIHDADGAAFAKEASGGSDPKLKAFAAETHVIVLRHIGEIKAVGPTSP